MDKNIDSMELYKKGVKIQEEIESSSEIVSSAEAGDASEVKEKIEKLAKEKEELRESIYKIAKEKSGLDYSKDDKNPELLKKQYTEKIDALKKRKQQLRLEKINAVKLKEQKKAQIDEQFNIASEKYKMMLDSGKITPELYEARIKNMNQARIQDKTYLSDKIKSIEDESLKIDAEIKGIKGKLTDIEKQEIIYNEYEEVYFRLFGETMPDKNKPERESVKKDIRDSAPSNEGTKENIVKNSEHQASPVNATNKGNIEQQTPGQNGGAQVEQPQPEKEETKIETPKIIVTNKKMFNELYKKMKSGEIEDNELNALVETLENPNNYDKFGITTGRVFNKAKKILKYKGERTAKSVESFLRENSVFAEGVQFNPDIEDDQVLPHDMLKSWRQVDDKLVYTDASLSVEKYIEAIEKYKADGHTLTKEQEEILGKATSLKTEIASYRKAINANQSVKDDRKEKMKSSAIYRFFMSDGTDKTKALPETDEHSKGREQGYIVMDLKSMTRSPEEAARDEASSKPGRVVEPTEKNR